MGKKRYKERAKWMESLADRIENRWKGKNKKSKKARANAANMRTKANRIKNKRRIA